MSSTRNPAWKLLDLLARKADRKTLDKLRAVVPQSIKRKLSRFLIKNVASDEAVVVAKSGHKFVSISEPVFLQVRYGGEYEKELSEVARQLISAGDIVVDIGANFGWYTILMADKVGKTGRVFSFEPNGVIFGVLEQNISLNGFGDRVQLVKCGVGEHTAEGRLVAQDSESAIGYLKGDDGSSAEVAESVEIHPLDELVKGYVDQISFMKIDVEGFEPFVLRGAKSVLSAENPPAIQMEFNTEALERAGADIGTFIAELKALGGVIAVISHGSLQPLASIPNADANLFILPSRGRYACRPAGIKITK